ncbi:Ig-like domain-containing protein [Melittangium boletus]|uniref:SbsA Ig-like domain-containing protein n=1 Tax=Melittangium boletus DSM 14713 TaxID=1294270 RepID=A0A250IPG9_9BACT|nr:Ig-like domain-containing protein [Melittangium boletus]ATB33067.1 hypothetical protein MEBOL_006556 [Melittangium boletus DSM 14713]
MRRLLWVGLLGCAGCLEPGDPFLSAADTKPPEVVSTEPGPGGTVSARGTVQILFSERMETRTLRPGIAVFEGRVEVPLTVTAPPELEGEDGVERGDVPSTITVSAEAGSFTPGTAYTLVLRTLLTDSQGNPLAQEVRVPFRTEP